MLHGEKHRVRFKRDTRKGTGIPRESCRKYIFTHLKGPDLRISEAKIQIGGGKPSKQNIKYLAGHSLITIYLIGLLATYPRKGDDSGKGDSDESGLCLKTG